MSRRHKAIEEKYLSQSGKSPRADKQRKRADFIERMMAAEIHEETRACTKQDIENFFENRRTRIFYWETNHHIIRVWKIERDDILRVARNKVLGLFQGVEFEENFKLAALDEWEKRQTPLYKLLG